MAQEKDITRRAKFFTRKKGCQEELLCEVCRHHQHVLMVRFGCDAMIFTDTRLRGLYDYIEAARDGRSIHFWCIDADDPPGCLEQFKQAGAFRG